MCNNNFPKYLIRYKTPCSINKFFLFQSLGNHEFDNGVSGLKPYIEALNCPVLAANLILNKEPDLKTVPNLMKSFIFNVTGEKVAIIGYLTPDTKISSVSNNVEYVEEVEAIIKEVAKLKKEGINIFIALGHSGFIKDLQIAKEVEDIDLVIGGHSNTFLWNGTKPDSEDPQGYYPTLVKQASGRLVPVVQVYTCTKYLGKLHLIFDSRGEIVNYNGNPILLDKNVPEDLEISAIVNRYRNDVLKVTQVVVGSTTVILNSSKCRLQECNIGNLIADAIVYKYASEYKGNGWTDAPIAVMQSGGIRNSISRPHLPFNITAGDLLYVMPFDGTIVKVTVNGTNIMKMLEHAVKRCNIIRSPGRVLQVSGILVEYDFEKPQGRRVVKAYARCGVCEVPTYEAINKTKEYKILMPSFLSMGGDGFEMFINAPSEPLHYNELQSTTEYIKKFSPIYPAIEGRIKIFNANKVISNSASTILPKILIALAAITCFSLI